MTAALVAHAPVATTWWEYAFGSDYWWIFAVKAVGVLGLLVTAAAYASLAERKVSARIQQTADAQPCPSALPDTYLTFLGTDDEQVQTCTGGKGQNSWYGSGQVNAFSAISR